MDNHGRKFGKFRAVIDLVEVFFVCFLIRVEENNKCQCSHLVDNRRDHLRVKTFCLFATASSLLRTVFLLSHFVRQFQSEKNGDPSDGALFPIVSFVNRRFVRICSYLFVFVSIRSSDSTRRKKNKKGK